MKLDPCLSLFTKVNLKWIKEQNVKPETMKLPGEHIKKPCQDIGIGT
jgi:hypothetical protein